MFPKPSRILAPSLKALLPNPESKNLYALLPNLTPLSTLDLTPKYLFLIVLAIPIINTTNIFILIIIIMGIGDKVNAFGRGMKKLGKKVWSGTKLGLKIAGGTAIGLAALGATEGAILGQALGNKSAIEGAMEGAMLPVQLAKTAIKGK